MALLTRDGRPPKVKTRDGRSPDSIFLRRARADLTRHLGGKVSVAQAALIERAAMLQLHIARMDERAIAAGEFSDHGSRHYLAWTNSLSRLLRQLGVEPAAPPVKTLTEHLAERDAAKAAAQRASQAALAGPP